MPLSNAQVAPGAAAGSIPGDCDNTGLVDLRDYAGFFLAETEGCPSPLPCRCYDLNNDGCPDLRDFAVFQYAFKAAQDTSGPAPDNVFVLQLADYHARCDAGDGGDMVCHVGDPCCQTHVGPPNTPCDSPSPTWVLACDANADAMRDLKTGLNTQAEWDDFFWSPDDACNTLAAEHYPPGPLDDFFVRHFMPMCTDGSTPPKGTTVCPDGQPIIQCTDGTRPLFYYDAGTTDRWIIKVQNGAITCKSDCWEDVKRTSFSSAWAANRAARSFTGLYKPFLDAPFSSYNRIIIDKCVGDRNCGSNTLETVDQLDDAGNFKGTATVYFHGFRELQALLSYLTVWDGGNRLTPNSQILIANHSNGSNGMYMYIDRIADFIRHDPSDGIPGLGLIHADVRGLASSFVVPSVESENLINQPQQNIYAWNDYATAHFDDHVIAPLSLPAPEGANGLWYSSLAYFNGTEFNRFRAWGAIRFDTATPASANDIAGITTIDESCFAAHGLFGGPTGNLEACLDSMHVLLNHVTTPLFLSPQLHDSNLKKTPLNSLTRITDAFATLGYTPHPGSVCGSHDENFPCTAPALCPPDISPCDPHTTVHAEYHATDFSVRVRAITRGATGQSSGTPEESPADVAAPVGHAVFAPEWSAHDSWEKPEKMDYQMCDGIAPGPCAWQSAPLWAALKSWIELDATVICVERDLPGVDPNRPLTAWSQTTPGPLLDDRCGVQP